MAVKAKSDTRDRICYQCTTSSPLHTFGTTAKRQVLLYCLAIRLERGGFCPGFASLLAPQTHIGFTNKSYGCKGAASVSWPLQTAPRARIYKRKIGPCSLPAPQSSLKLPNSRHLILSHAAECQRLRRMARQR